MLLLGTSAVGIAVVLVLLLVLDRTPTVWRADAATTARLVGTAAQYEAN